MGAKKFTTLNGGFLTPNLFLFEKHFSNKIKFPADQNLREKAIPLLSTPNALPPPS